MPITTNNSIAPASRAHPEKEEGGEKKNPQEAWTLHFLYLGFS